MEYWPPICARRVQCAAAAALASARFDRPHPTGHNPAVLPRTIARVIVLLAAIPALLAMSVLPPEHVHRIMDDHAHGVAHRHEGFHAQVHAAGDEAPHIEAREATDEAHAVWVGVTALHRLGAHVMLAVVEAASRYHGPLSPSSAVLRSIASAPAHGPPSHPLDTRGPPLSLPI